MKTGTSPRQCVLSDGWSLQNKSINFFLLFGDGRIDNRSKNSHFAAITIDLRGEGSREVITMIPRGEGGGRPNSWEGY